MAKIKMLTWQLFIWFTKQFSETGNVRFLVWRSKQQNIFYLLADVGMLT